MNPLSPTPGNKPSHLKESINSGCDYLKQESAHCISAISDFARTRLGKVLQILLVLGVITEASYLTTRKDTSEIEMQHDGYQFSLEDMPLREKLSQLMVGSPYDSRTSNFLDNAFSKTPILSSNFIDWASDWLKTDENTGGVHIFGSDAGDPEEANRTIVELMAKSKIPPLPSMDVVGGYTRHLGLTPADV